MILTAYHLAGTIPPYFEKYFNILGFEVDKNPKEGDSGFLTPVHKGRARARLRGGQVGGRQGGAQARGGGQGGAQPSLIEKGRPQRQSMSWGEAWTL